MQGVIIMKSIFGFLLLIVGGLSAISPETAWQLNMGWKFKDAEPSDAYLLYTRIVGIVSCLIGLVLIFTW